VNSSIVQLLDLQLDASDSKSIACRCLCLCDALIVHERAVGARQIFDVERVLAGGDPAVEPRNKGGVEDEVGAPRAAEGPGRTSWQPERQGPVVRASKNPHFVVVQGGAAGSTRAGRRQRFPQPAHDR